MGLVDLAVTDRRHVKRKCYTRASLTAGAWVEIPWLDAEQLVLRTGNYATATLSYDFGAKVKRPDSGAAVSQPPLSIVGQFVLVEVRDQDDVLLFDWAGYVTGVQNERGGVFDFGAGNEFVGGRQLFTAVGLSYFLDRRQVTSAVVYDGVTIQRPMTFNGGLADYSTSIGASANRHTALGASGVYEFAKNETGSPWTAEQIAHHLIEHYTASFPCPLTLNTTDASDYLSGFTPVIRTERQTVFSLLNLICNPARGLTWWLEFDDVAPLATIRVNSSATAGVGLPGGGTLVANSEQCSLNFDNDKHVVDVQLGFNDSTRYDQVVCRGARYTTTFTVGVADGTLAGDWTAANEAAYKAGAHDLPDTITYDALSAEHKQKANDAYRKRDELYRVYRCFRIPTNFDGTVADGSASPPSAADYAFPELDDDGTVLGTTFFNLNGMRLLTRTPLKHGLNYATAANPTGELPTGSAVEYMPPFAIVQVGFESGKERYQFTDRLTAHQATEVEDAYARSITQSYHLHPEQTTPGFRLQAGYAQHGLAFNHWSGAEPTEHDPEVDYATLRATICVEADKFCEGKYPAADPMEPAQILELQLSEEYRLDYLCAQTVVGLNNGVPVLTNGGRLRDDRQSLADIARLAYEWYQVTRYTLVFTVHGIAAWENPTTGNVFGLGSLITTIGTGATQTTINTLVGEVEYNFLAGTSRFQTLPSNLDPRAFA